MSIRDYLNMLRRSWYVVVVLTLLGAGAGWAYSALSVPQYSSTARVFVSTSGGDSVAELQQGNSFTQQRVKTYADLVSTPIVLDPVVSQLGLNETVTELSARVSASAPLNTTLIEITATDPDPVQAAAIATAASDSLTSAVAQIETVKVDGESPVRLTLVQPAVASLSPVSPRTNLNIALGALIGLAAAIGVAVLRDALDTRLRGVKDIEAITDVPIIGGIVFDPKAKQRPLIVHADPLSPRAEAFRTLRTNLQFLRPAEGQNGYVITSSLPGEGKSTTSINLALTLADSGLRVLLVDTDLRRPSVAKYMDVEGSAGLTDVLIGRVQAVDVIHQWGRRQLYVLPAGRIAPNPSELIGSAAMSKLIKQFGEAFDVVLYDTPPILPVTDAAVLAKQVGLTILVASANATHRGQFDSAMNMLATAGVKVSGVIVNMLPAKAAKRGAYGAYGYGSAYAYTGTEPPYFDASTPRREAAGRAVK